MPLKKFDHKDLAPRLKRLAKKYTLTQAAEKLNLERHQVIYICRKNGISFRPKGKRNYNTILEESDIPLIKQLASEGMKTHIIAQKFECGDSLIRKVVNGNAWQHV